MTAIAVAAAKSSPGVSTVAELLAQLGPPAFRPLLVDADPAGGDWLLRPGVAPEPGLSSLAMVGRRGLRAGELSEHVQRLGPGLRVLVAPAAGRQATASLHLVAEQLSEVLSGLDAVIDCGSLFEGSPAMPLLRVADLVMLVGRPTAGAMVHLAPWVEELRGDGTSVAVVLSAVGVPGRGATYRPAEVAEALGVEVLGTMADDPDTVARLSADPGRIAPLARTRLVRSMAPVAEAAFVRAQTVSHTEAVVPPVESEVVR